MNKRITGEDMLMMLVLIAKSEHGMIFESMFPHFEPKKFSLRGAFNESANHPEQLERLHTQYPHVKIFEDR